MLETTDLRRPTGCSLILKALLSASVLASAGCAQLPHMDSPPSMRKIEQLPTANSFSAPATAWPGDQWWQAYGDPQLSGLIDEALQGAPDLKLAQARLAAAAAVVRGAESTRIPEVTGSAAITEEKQSYNYLIPPQALPRGWNDYGLATLNFSWELDFWGKNRSALAAALSDQQAARFEYAETRLLLSTSVAAAYAGLVDLYTAAGQRRRDAETARGDGEACFGSGTISGWRTSPACARWKRGGPPPRRNCAATMSASAYRAMRIAALLGAGPDRGLAIARPSAHFARPRRACRRTLRPICSGRRPDILAARSRAEAAAHRIDEKKAGFYPSVNLIAFVGVQSLGIREPDQGGIPGRLAPARRCRCPSSTRAVCRGPCAARAPNTMPQSPPTTRRSRRPCARWPMQPRAARRSMGSSRPRAPRSPPPAEAHQLVRKRYEGALATYLDVLEAEDELISARRAQADSRPAL